MELAKVLFKFAVYLLEATKDAPKLNKNAALKRFFIFGLLTLLIGLGNANAQKAESNKINKVVIDPGHGGHDPGNLGTRRYSTREKDIALSISLKLGGYIKENMPDVEVIYTRKTDKFVTLKKRTEIANQAEADLFISLHCDAFQNSRVHGTSSYVMGQNHGDENMRVAEQENSVILLEENYEENYTDFDPSKPETYIALTMYQQSFLEQSITLAQKIQDQFGERVHRRNRGVKQQPLYVTSRTTMPSVLVELGFLTNPSEEDFLNSEKGQAYMASAVYRAFRGYKNHRESIKITTTTSTNTEAPEEQEVGEQQELGKDDNDVREVEEDKTLEAFYSVQIITSAFDKEHSDPIFEGLEEVNHYKEGSLYKYYTGKFEELDKARAYKSEMREKGFNGAFVIAIKQGERLSLSEAESILQ